MTALSRIVPQRADALAACIMAHDTAIAGVGRVLGCLDRMERLDGEISVSLAEYRAIGARRHLADMPGDKRDRLAADWAMPSAPAVAQRAEPGCVSSASPLPSVSQGDSA